MIYYYMEDYIRPDLYVFSNFLQSLENGERDLLSYHTSRRGDEIFNSILQFLKLILKNYKYNIHKILFYFC